MNSEPTRRPNRFRYLDGLILLILAGLWCAAAAHATAGKRCVLYDTFRDLAWAENMRAGRIWADPTFRGLGWWYAPGNPLIMATLARVSGRPAVDVYASSIFWFNGLLPIALYVLVRSACDRAVAIVALLAVFVGSYWWLTHALTNIPGIQTTVFILFGLWSWQQASACSIRSGPENGAQLRATAGWASVAGLVLAAATWQHPLCGMVLAAAIFLHAVLSVLVEQDRRCRSWRHYFAAFFPVAAVGSVAVVLTFPLITQMLKVSVHRSMMLRFFASELLEPQFYANALAPLSVPAALLGGWYILRCCPRLLWAVGMWVFCLAGQLAGYLGSRAGCYVPYALPHEFQWHGQLAAGISAAVGVAGLARRLGGRVRGHLNRRLTSGLLLVAFTAAAFGPGLRGAADVGRYFIELDPLLERTSNLRAWIHQNTTLEDVFICPREFGYQVVAGLTGRKCIAVSPGHTNPQVDLARHLADLETVLSTADEEVFINLARHYGACYLLLLCQNAQECEHVRQRYDGWRSLRLAFADAQAGAVVYEIARQER